MEVLTKETHGGLLQKWLLFRIIVGHENRKYTAKADLDAHPTLPNSWRLNKLQVDPLIRRQGFASDLLNQCTSFADDNGVTIYCDPVANGGFATDEELENFYKKYGFRETTRSHGRFQYTPQSKNDPQLQSQGSNLTN